jgi:HPt (histidine-containing phosphotransfer) domain-containing protein
MDLDAALDRMDGDHDLFLTLAGMFIERSAQDIEAIRTALASRNFPMLSQQAHKLKGSALEFCAEPAGSIAQRLEDAARRSALRDAQSLCSRFEAEVARLTAELKTVIAKGLPS